MEANIKMEQDGVTMTLTLSPETEYENQALGAWLDGFKKKYESPGAMQSIFEINPYKSFIPKKKGLGRR